ncbi:MAG: terpene cyclase/mutase family protein [Pirellulales bacterium]|nr:terpene cyclase/mutase family protein [Pirellulales bacterium]
MTSSDTFSSSDLGIVPAAEGAIWLDGDVLACACPDCGAPMSIRLWLLVADCFRCGASIELTYEQEALARRLLDQREAQRTQAAREAAATIRPTAARTPTRPLPAPPPRPSAPAVAPAPRPADAPPTPRRVPAALAHRGPRARIRRLYQKGPVGVLWGDVLKNLPAWLVSLVLHLIAMLLLGLWAVEPPERPRGIFLSTAVSYQDLAGQSGEPDEPSPDAFEFDEPGGVELVTALDTPGAAEEPLPATRLDPSPPISVGTMPSLTPPSTYNIDPPAPGRMFRGRDPELRANMVEREGGTSFTEAAVARGLEWLARHQNENGSWSLHAFADAPGCRGQCGGAGGVRSDVAATALALLPMLGAGQTHTQGPYRDAVFRGLHWLVDQQRSDGDLRGQGEGRMYAHGQAAIVLCEAYGLTGDDQLREPAQKALDFIVWAQHRRGGWRYEPREPADTSVVGWQLMALRSGDVAGLNVPSPVYGNTSEYLDRAQTDRRGGYYAYMPGQPPTHVMTAEALLCRQYLGWPKDHPGLAVGIEYLMNHPPSRRQPNVYYWYYASQVLHHVGGKDWNEWNGKMRVLLADMQETKGHEAGSWAPVGDFSAAGGRLYMTSLAICTLEVYYRHLPLYREDVLGLGMQ